LLFCQIIDNIESVQLMQKLLHCHVCAVGVFAAKSAYGIAELTSVDRFLIRAL
jgi:hypothetical protein